MNIGIPKEIMTGEGRVGLTPSACKTLLASSHKVFIEAGAGERSGYSDEDYQLVGVQSLVSAKQLYESADLIVKVKQPLGQDLEYLRVHHTLFCYLHLAADLPLIQSLADIGLTAIPFESIKDQQGNLPLLAPMSQIAGRIAAMRGASLLFRNRGGRGVLLGGIDGSEAGSVVILGAGVAGSHAAMVCSALGAHVNMIDLDERKLQQLKILLPSIKTHLSTPDTIKTLCIKADLVIGAVLLAGRRAPVVLMKSVVKQMYQGSVIVDIAIDQGGCVEGIRQTSSEELSYVDSGVILTAVPNMPATVARTASQSLSSAVLPYVEELASMTHSQRNDLSPRQQALHQAIAVQKGYVADELLRREIETYESNIRA